MPKVEGARVTKKDPKITATQSKQYNHAVYFDPGDRYTGVAIFDRDPTDNTWDCVDAFTWDLEQDGMDDIYKLQVWLYNQLEIGAFDIVGYEVWRLYEDKAQEQKGSEFLASQLIGAIKFIVRFFQKGKWPGRDIELVRFLPDRKKATAGIMRSRGISSEARRRKTKGDHAWDAELQGFFDIVNNRGWTYTRKAPTE